MKRQRNSLTGLAFSAECAGSRRLIAAAALLAGCSGSIDANNSAAPPQVGAPADEEPAAELPPGAVVNADGTVTNADGTPITNADGTPIVVAMNPDGTPVANPDGTPVTNPDGTPVTPETPVTNPDGTPVTPETPVAVEPAPDAPAAPECVPGVPGTSQLPRLTKLQYDNTIRDLVGLTTQPSALLAPDTPGSVDQRAWDGYQAAAESVAAQIMADPNARAMAIPCTPSGDGLACAQEFIAEFGGRAFRRPLTPEETTRFEALYTNGAQVTETGTFDEIAQVLLRAFLVSPSFLTRAELTEQAEGSLYVLNGWEVASRLSYMLWASMPDDTLFSAAAANALSTPEQILEQATRMLQDNKARGQVASFHQQYALMGPGTRWAEIDRDPAIYPAFDQAMVPVLSEETERLFDYLVFDQGGSFQDLMLTPTAFVNASTAPLYGLDAGAYGADLTLATLDATRPGIFTRLGFLTSFSKFDRPSPILRGAFLQKEVLCTEIPAPPPGAAGTAFPTEGLTTNRERTEAQTSGGDCVTCHHTIVNPTGYTLEGFDGIGAARTMDNGVPVNTVANVPIGTTVVEVVDAVDMMNKIAASSAAQHCYAEKWVKYAYERPANSADACVVETMVSQMQTSQGAYSVLDLVADLTQSDSFRYRAVETEVAQ